MLMTVGGAENLLALIVQMAQSNPTGSCLMLIFAKRKQFKGDLKDFVGADGSFERVERIALQ